MSSAASTDGSNSQGPGETRAIRAKRPQRPRELQDPLNHYLYHPLAWQLARQLAKTPLTPNMVSVFGGLMVVLAAVCYAGLPYPLSAALGMALHMSWHVIDGADGDLARLTGRASPIGEMVDGLSDYISHIILYLIMGWVLSHGAGVAAGWKGWALILFAGISHAIQSNHVEVQRRQYQYWVYGTPWLRSSHGQADSATSKTWAASLVSAYIGVANGMTPFALKVDDEIAKAKGDQTRLDEIAVAVRAEAPPLLLLCKVLGPNPRAIVLGISMFLGTPLWYMFYQSIVLNLLMAISVSAHNAAAKRIAAKIGTR